MSERMACYHGADECPEHCMCPCDLCDLLRMDAYTGDAVDIAVHTATIPNRQEEG